MSALLPPPWERSEEVPSPISWRRSADDHGGARPPSPQLLRPWAIRTRDYADNDFPPWLSQRPPPPQLSPRSPVAALPDIDWLEPETNDELQGKFHPSSPAAVCNVCESIYRGAVCKCAQLWCSHPIAKILSRTRRGNGLPAQMEAMSLSSPSRRIPVARQDRPTGSPSSRASTSRASTSRASTSRASTSRSGACSTNRSACWNDEQPEEDHIFRV